MHSYILLIVDQENENHGTRTSNFRLLQAKEKNGYEKVPSFLCQSRKKRRAKKMGENRIE